MARQEEEKRVPLGISYFTHRRGDCVGALLALSCLLPILFIAAQSTLVVALHPDAQLRRLSASVLLGQLVNELANLVLKRAIRQSRPDGAIRNDYGMPSSHAQFMAHLATVVGLLTCHAPEDSNYHAYALAIRLLFWAASLTVAYARIYDGSHSTAQVLVGVGVGTVSGGLWYRLVLARCL